MPQWAGSCWYFLRFVDPRNADEAWSRTAADYWMPVDLYVGGAEHAVLHLLYARFWHKVFYDLGLVHTKEPFQKLVNQGMILGESFRYYDDNPSDKQDVPVTFYSAGEVTLDGEAAFSKTTGAELKARWIMPAEVSYGADGRPYHPAHPELRLEPVIEKMSKSRGNVVNPDDVVDELGADSLRLYEMFLGPLEKAAPWSTKDIQGVSRFLHRAWRLLLDDDEDRLRELAPGDGTPEQARLTAATIAGVSDDIEAMRFNTAISKLMVIVRDVARDAPLPENAARAFVLLLSPFAPHLAEELWQRLGHATTLAYEPWPEADRALLVADTVTLAVQVNGKRRGRDPGGGRRRRAVDPAGGARLRGRPATPRGSRPAPGDRRTGTPRQRRRLTAPRRPVPSLLVLGLHKPCPEHFINSGSASMGIEDGARSCAKRRRMEPVVKKSGPPPLWDAYYKDARSPASSRGPWVSRLKAPAY